MSVPLYTRSGDEGYTGVLGKERVPKYSTRTEAYGTVDEASAALGIARVKVAVAAHRALILQVQRDLYALMADLATVPEAAKRPPWLTPERTAWLEQTTDATGAALNLPPEFIVTGDSEAGAYLDLARTIIRRAERIVARLAHDSDLRDDEPLRYLNRLSSLLFALARAEDKAAGADHFTTAKLG